ncbi:MAG: prolipoprotein diacylglyceryl transferase [Candidatus Moranbacteria bacterium RIFCSPHIGHO2_12_FULL_54_9]|nr:MAG: prolipoprotein diacylglyceryl transferase [Candidatus Moranbacteria bacterium RIFCSPHIGHO2_01_FULL_54_31]OGI26422.1 MAG: prolipoprotein diacylglyceryl transferase [Candidatus Moranbacteria bacterium RIFCSPHIGHO2_12_FULL_54_9]
MQEWWQHLPETLHPIAFTIGFFSVYWYAVWFLLGFFVTLVLALWFARRGMTAYSGETVVDICLVLFFGAVLGGRLGYVLFYHPDVFLAAPYAIVLPYDFAHGVWIGISGMSYHGGLIGAAFGLLWFARKRRIPFWQAADFVALLAPIAVFFGRLGNFFNVELAGRVTEQPWGMLFPGMLPEGALRHPSALYEALVEGVALFIILIFLKRFVRTDGYLASWYLALYAIARFVAECFREPDPQLGLFFGVLSMGQILSLAMFAAAGVIFLWLRRQNYAKIIQNS